MSYPSLDESHFPHSLAHLYEWLDGTAEVTTSHTATTNAAFAHAETELTTSGSGAAEAYAFGTTPGVKPGHRKLVTLAAKGAAGDSVTIDFANLAVTGKTVSAAALTTVGQFILVEWRPGLGNKWLVVDATAGVVTAA